MAWAFSGRHGKQGSRTCRRQTGAMEQKGRGSGCQAPCSKTKDVWLPGPRRTGAGLWHCTRSCNSMPPRPSFLEGENLTLNQACGLNSGSRVMKPPEINACRMVSSWFALCPWLSPRSPFHTSLLQDCTSEATDTAPAHVERAVVVPILVLAVSSTKEGQHKISSSVQHLSFMKPEESKRLRSLLWSHWP